MSARFGSSVSGDVGGAVGTAGRRRGLPWMSKKETDAYLISRDALRRIQRTSPLVLPTLEARIKFAERSEAFTDTNRMAI